MKDEDCTCEWVTIHDMTGDIQEVMAQKDQFCISHGMVKCICIWDQTYNMHADPVPYISEIHPRCPQHTDAALQGICDLCEQELILTHDDCWHPHTVEIACPPPDHRGLGSGRPGKEHWKPSNAF